MRTVTLLGCVVMLIVSISQSANADAPPEVAPPPRESVHDTATTRSLRWVIRFKVDSGKDYLNQLGALDAALVLPNPTDTEKAILIPNAKKPADKRQPTDKDFEALLKCVYFIDARKEATEALAAHLELDFKPTSFVAVLPKEWETELARKEKWYRNRLPAQIEQTVFRITVRDGKAEIIVYEQLVKKP
jgi:hypothetical protein